MAANVTTLRDSDGEFSDWVEIHNPEQSAVNLAGWHLTDTVANRTKWSFPEIVIPSGGYLVVFASNKDRRDPARELHTNFALSAEGEYLGLIKPDGQAAASEFHPQYPPQTDDAAYGIPAGGGPPGRLTGATPGRANTTALLAEKITFSRKSGPFLGTFTLTLGGAGPNQRIRYATTALTSPNMTAAEPTAASPEYTGPLVITSSVAVRAAVFSADDNARSDVASAYFSRLGSSVENFSSELPVLVIDGLGAGDLVKDGADHPSWMYVYAARAAGGPTFGAAPEIVTPMTMTVRGSSSAEFPKKGYNLKLADEDGKKNPQSLVGLPAHEKWALVAPWAFDHGYVNNSVIYTLSNQLGRWAPRTRLVEVFNNTGGDAVEATDYAGIYIVTDRIESGTQRVNIPALSGSDNSGSALTGGYILKQDVPDPDEFAWRTRNNLPSNPLTSVVLVEPKAEDVTPAQRTYIVNYVQEMEDALLADQRTGFAQRTYLDFIDRPSWVDHHILNVLACNPDAFDRSAYFTKPRDGRLQAGPVWDFDRSLGSFWDERSRRYDVWFGFTASDVWQTGWWGIIARDPEFMQEWVDRWQSLRRKEMSNDSLFGLIDGLAGNLGGAAARDAARWPDNATTKGDYTGQIAYLKDWITYRAEWIDEQFTLPPRMSENGGAITFTAPSGTQLAYTLDGSDPRSVGGEIAPNAVLTSAAVTVPMTANVHVRTYRAAARDVFPGSPWSSAVGGAGSSPLSPRARLINISSRAMVGANENALIAGVVVADTKRKQYLARAVGPGLAAFGATDLVPDPQLSIFSSGGVELYRNNAWETGVDGARLPAYSSAVGAFPLAPGSLDSALANTMGAGAYTVQVTTPSDRRGIGLAELYELDDNGRTVNLSTRANVRPGDGALIGGFVVKGPAYKRMLIRAIGPTLAAFGVANALADPVMRIYSGSNVIASNDRWDSGSGAVAVVAATKAAGAFALAGNSEDAALLITLPPGPFTVQVSGKDNAEGVALLEVYEVP